MRAWPCLIVVAVGCGGPEPLDCARDGCGVPSTWSAAQTREAWGNDACAIALFTCETQGANHVVDGKLGMAVLSGIDSGSWYFYDNRGTLFEIIYGGCCGAQSTTERNDPADQTPDVDACMGQLATAGQGFRFSGCPPPI